MLRSLVLLAVVYMATADEQAAGGIGAGFAGIRGAIEPRLAASGIRIARLERVLAELKEQIDKAAKIDPQGFIDEINDRLDAVEKPRCVGKKDVPCGRDSSECVSTLLLCDGKEDCHNGYDEDEDTCSQGPIKAGNIFTGTATWSSCRMRKDHPVQVQITAVLKSKFFGARLGVRATVGADFAEDDDHDHHTYDVKGYYVFAKKRLVLIPVERGTKHLGVVCSFKFGGDAEADCKLVHEATLSECAEFFVTQQH